MLGGGHAVLFGGGGVVVAGEVQEAVDGVEGEFGGGVVAKFAGAGGGDRGADEDFAVGEGDDIRRAGDAEEVAVDFCHGASAEDRDLDGRERGEFGVVFFRQGEAAGEGVNYQSLQRAVVVSNSPTAVGYR